MDPLSFTASLVALVNLSGAVVSGCYTYIGKVRAAPNEIRKIAAEINDLKGILEHLRSLAGDDEARLPSLMSLASPNGAFESCTSTLQELARKLKSINEASEVRKRLLWPIDGGKLEEILLKVEKHKTTFILALAGDSARSNIQVENVITEVQSTLDDMKIEQRRTEVLQWLKGADPSTNHNAARRKHEPNTGNWLLKSDTLGLWKKEAGQILWLNGIPGAGKTILSSMIIENLSALCVDGSENQVAFYYFDFNDHGKQTVSGCLQSLILQLCVQSKYLHKDVLSLYDDCHAGTRNPTMEELTVVLTSLLSRSSQTWVVIDALDECDEEERREFYTALTEIKTWATGNHNMFITSRPEADIRHELSNLSTFVIDMQNDLVDEDIRSHVRVCLAKDSRLSKWPQPVKKEIENALTSKASGMFRWAVCQLDVLRKCFKIGNMRNALGSLPLTLNETYERIFKNVPAENIREMRTILMLLAFSTRPMTVQEVSEATAINLKTKHFDPEDRFPDPHDILALCSSLVSLVDAGSDSMQVLRREKQFTSFGISGSESPKILRFSHFSVKEYVLSESFHTTSTSEFYISESISQRCITEICLTYLLDFSNGERVQKFDHEEFPFLTYAGLHWVKHWKAVSESNKDDIELLLSRLFDPTNLNSFMNFLNLYDPKSENCKPGAYRHGILAAGYVKRNKEDFDSPLTYASYYGLTQIASWMLSKNNPSKVELAIALRAAGSEGHIDVVKLLLAHGANPNENLPGQGDNVLQSAIRSCKPTVVALILDAGADVLVHRGEQGTALHVAAAEGSTEIIAMLLDHGAQINAWAQAHGTPMIAAATAGKDFAVSYLVMKGADVNIRGGPYGTALNTACEFAGIEAVKSIVGAGADVTPKALYEAALRAELDTMRLLIPKTKINAICGFYGTALQASIQSRNPASFFLMLESGADINAQGGFCGSPLSQAIWAYNPTAIHKLLELGAKFGDSALVNAIDSNADDLVPVAIKLLQRGANPNAEHKTHGNVLQLAIFKRPQGFMDLIRCLLDKGADVNAVEGEYGTALQTAVYQGREDIVRILIDYGADINLIGGEFGNALQAATIKKQYAIVRFLIEKGANVNAVGGRYGCALQAAASTGEMSLVELLMSHGADINIAAGEYVTPLRAAIANGHLKMTELFLDRGADINIYGEGSHSTVINRFSVSEFNSAIEIAAVSDDTSIMQMLLDRGADLNETEASLRSPLSLAVGYGTNDTNMLKFLLKNGADVKKYGGEAIYSAVSRGMAESVQILIENGADVNSATDSFSGSALQECIGAASWKENDKIFILLLDGGADVNAASGFYGTALQRAIDVGNKSMVMELLKRGADINGAGSSYGTPLTPLGAAAAKGDEEMFRLLLERGASVDVKDDKIISPLRIAIRQNYYTMAHELLDRGADVNSKGDIITALATASWYGNAGQLELVKRLVSLGAVLDACPVDSYGTALQMAASAGNEPVFKYLLEQGAGISVGGGSCGNPLTAAVDGGHAPMTKLILASGAEVNAVGGEFHTALQTAAWQGNDDIINSLLDAGADVNIEGGYHGSPLQAASRIGRIRHVKLFLNRGAKVNTNIGTCGYPLAAAAKGDNFEVAEILLEHGADVNCPGGKYGFPLQAAACYKQVNEDEKSVIDLLLQNGADVNAAGGKYGSALQAAAYHHKQPVEILLKHGADVNSRGGNFGSPLKAARKKGLARVVKLLLQHGATDD